MSRAVINIIVATVGTFLVLIIISYMTYNHLHKMQESDRWVIHTNFVRLKNNELLKHLMDIETGQRGYLITKKDIYLDSYYEGRERLDKSIAELKDLVRDDERQMKAVDTIARLAKRRLRYIDYNIHLYLSSRTLDYSVFDKGKLTMDQLRKLSQDFEDVERHLLQVRVQERIATDRRMVYYLLGLAMFAMAFLGVFFRMLYIELNRRMRAQQELEVRLKELEHANAELEQFAYITSHDLQEPLRKIRSFSERIVSRQATNLTDDAKLSLNKIGDSAARMQNLINDLLVFSRAKNISENFEDTNLNKVLAEAKDTLSLAISEKNAQIISPTLPTVFGIEGQMVQLFTNLIGNSLKYNRENTQPVIEITYRQAKGAEIEEAGVLLKDNNYHCLTFIDNGIGFDAQYAEKIFVIFQRLHNKNEYGGSGIGLALCKRIITNHHGFIRAKPRTDAIGAIFEVFLPTNSLNDKRQERRGNRLLGKQ